MVTIVLVVLAVVCFLLVTFGVALGSVNLLPLGLVFMAAALLPWGK